jgi:NAD(P)-dependent dehydrogenase (short-subunit alcohol dehydrogenase family)
MENQSIKRLVDPDDTAALAVFLASDAAKSISSAEVRRPCEEARRTRR